MVFKVIGYAALPGMAYGLAIRFAQIFWSAIGLAIYGCLMARRKNSLESSMFEKDNYVKVAGSRGRIRACNQPVNPDTSGLSIKD
jgi:hypothetical protein